MVRKLSKLKIYSLVVVEDAKAGSNVMQDGNEVGEVDVRVDREKERMDMAEKEAADERRVDGILTVLLYGFSVKDVFSAS